MAGERPSLPSRVEYSRPRVLRLLSVSARRLSRWERTGLVAAKRRYGYQDLVSLQKLRQLSSRLSPHALREGLTALRSRVPDLDPLTDLGLFASRRRLEARVDGLRMEAVSGQLLLAFPADKGAVVLQHRSRPAAVEAEEWFAYGVSLEERPENRDLAAAAYQRCLELDPRHASACINLGTLRYHQGDFLCAEEYYRRAIALDPCYALAYFDLGNVLDETGRMREAIAAYRQAVQLAPDYADAHYNLALACEKSGERRRAIPHWRRYLQLDSTSPWAMHARAQLRRSLAREPLAIVFSGRRSPGGQGRAR